MSKKKVSTMTLRDFHGGNIPSDLPLPSAPGMVVERKNHDRPGSGGWMGSSLHRGYSGDRVGFSRQGSGNFARSYEEKMSYLPNPANIGRNYDEDERKPVDGQGRRGQSSDFHEEPIYEQRQVGHERLPERYTLDNRGGYTPSKHVDFRSERHSQEDSSSAPIGSSGFRVDGFSRRASMYQQDSSAQPFASQDNTGHYSSQNVPPHSPYLIQEPVQPWRQNSLGQQPVTPGAVMGSGTGVQNVWTARRDGEYGRTYPTEYGVNDAATAHTPGLRIAQASALEKVSSGRWNSRIVQPSSETQVYAGDHGQSYGGSYEGVSMYSPQNSVRFPADYDRSVYSDRAAYAESGRGIDSLSLRDTRLNADKGNLQDTRREQYVEGRGGSLSEPNRYLDDRHAYGEIGQKGITGGQREPARFVGSRDSALPESGPPRVTNNRYNTNEAVPYSEARSTVQSNSGWVRPELSSRREYGEGTPLDANKGFSEFEKRGVSGRDVVIDREYAIPHRSYGLENQKERGPHLDGTYHVSGKEDVGYLNSPYLKSRDDFSQEVSDSSRSGRFLDRSRGSDADQNHPGRLHSPGSIHTPSQDSVGAANNVALEEGKGTPVERPKLKLLPRTKPLDADPLEAAVQEEGFEIIQSIGLSRSEGATGSGSGTSVLVVNAGGEEPVRTVERPKLSLKPRSQLVDVVPADRGSVKGRMSVFGGARPRELVLKDRGVDESVIVGTDLSPNPAPSPMSVRTPIEANRTSSGGLVGYGTEKQEKLDERIRRADQHESRMGRQDSGRLERLDSRGRREHIDLKDERRGPEQRHHQEKRESDRPDVDKQESWRRPAEVPQSPMPVGEGSSGGGGRPIQSAAELAQAFSRSTSFGSGSGASAQGYNSQRSPAPRTPGPGFGMGPETPGVRKADVPFSRLTESVSPGPRDFHVSGVQAGYRRTSAF